MLRVLTFSSEKGLNSAVKKMYRKVIFNAMEGKKIQYCICIKVKVLGS